VTEEYLFAFTVKFAPVKSAR